MYQKLIRCLGTKISIENCHSNSKMATIRFLYCSLGNKK